MDLLGGLNPAQREAVTTTDGPVLIIAGAGTGKTSVLTRRIAYLVQEKKAGPENILALTFTEKAAEEMKSRVAESLETSVNSMQISTFHSFCRSILIEDGKKINLPRDFHQLDNVDQWIVLRRLLPNLPLDYWLELSDPPRVIKDFCTFINRAKDELVAPAEYLAYAQKKRGEFEASSKLQYDIVSPFLKEEKYRLTRPQFATEWTQEQWLEFKQAGLELKKMLEIGEIYRRYQDELERAGKVDFGDLILKSYHLLKEDEAVQKKYQERFHYILVDEFQDTNIAQLELLRILAEPRRNLCVVGDDDQAIYRFRGASFASFVDFRNAYSDARIIKLTQNYRSTKNILTAAGKLIAQNVGARYESEKNLWTQRAAGEKVCVLVSPEFSDEARAVVDTIASKVDGSGTSGGNYGRFAILYRAHMHRDLVVEELERRHIPHIVVSPEGILSTEEVQDIIAYLQVVRNIKVGATSETLSLIRVLSDPLWRLSNDDVMACFSTLGGGTSLYEVIRTPERIVGLRKKAATQILQLVTMLDELVMVAETKSVLEVVQEVIARSRYNIARLEGLQTPEAQLTVALIGEFLRFVEAKSQLEENKTFIGFMEYLDYYVEGGGTIEPQALEPLRQANAVQCMTVHAAKGLEFDAVFVVGLTNNRFPTRKRPPAVSFPRELVKGVIPEGDLHLQEERRLFYVSMTRAKNELYLSTVDKKGNRMSRFLEEIGPQDSSYLAFRTVDHVPVELEAEEAGEFFRPSQKVQFTLFPVPERLRLSFSQIDTYQTCGLKYKFRYFYRIPTAPKGYYTYGDVQHRVLEEFFSMIKKGEEVSAETLTQLYEKHWRDEPRLWRGDTLQQREYKKRGYEELTEFYERNKDILEAPLALEENFSFEVGGHLVTGRIDRVDALDGEKVEVIDYKTGRPKDQKNADESLQLSIYALAAREKYKKEPARLSFYYLTSNEKVSSARSEKDLEETKEEISKVADSILRREFQATKGFHCDWCDFKPICPEWNRRGVR
jgi:DNA helicase-2/ATP-dependent DNA helicase PcrA